jgi:hypothetical protein
MAHRTAGRGAGAACAGRLAADGRWCVRGPGSCELPCETHQRRRCILLMQLRDGKVCVGRSDADTAPPRVAICLRRRGGMGKLGRRAWVCAAAAPTARLGPCMTHSELRAADCRCCSALMDLWEPTDGGCGVHPHRLPIPLRTGRAVAPLCQCTSEFRTCASALNAGPV